MFDVRVLASRGSLTASELRDPSFDGFKYSECRTTLLANGKAFVQFKFFPGRWLRKGDVIIVSGNPRYLNLFPLIFTSRLKGVKVVWWGHGWTAGSFGKRAALRRWLMRLADTVLLYTDREIEDLVKEGVSAHRLFATNNTIDEADVIRAASKCKESDLDAFGKAHGLSRRRNILFCGRVSKKAQLEMLVRALPLIVKAQEGAMLIVIGDGEERARIEDIAINLGVANRIVWAGRIYDEDSLAPWFRSSQVFVYPGAIGLSIMHAFAYSLPVITHDNARYHMPEFAALRPGENGITFEMGNIESLSDAVVQVLKNEDLRASLSRAAYETINLQFTMDNMVARCGRALCAATERRTSNSQD